MITPQSEHARLAGTIATFWRSASVAAPQGGLPPELFALGVMIHDRGYGTIDTMGIGQVDESIWVATQQRGIEMRCEDPVADTVALMHLRRLLSSHDSEEIRSLVSRADTRIEENIARLGSRQASGIAAPDRQAFENADTVTALCDMISFRACFEEQVSFSQSVSSGSQQIEFAVSVHNGGRVSLAPWPLSIPELHTVVIAYEADGYPDRLEPVLKPIAVLPA